MFRNFIATLTLAAFPAIASADALSAPDWCCPDFCKAADESAVLLPRSDNSGAFDLMLDGTRVPVMPGAFQGTSADRPMQYCVGYDAFGDPQIKCLLIPSIV